MTSFRDRRYLLLSSGWITGSYTDKALEALSGIRAGKVMGTSEQWRAFYSQERPCLADLLVDQNLKAVPMLYSDKYKKSELVEDAYEVTDFFPALGERGKWLRLTAADDPREVEQCHALGCSNFIIKPVEYEAFVNAVRHLGLFLAVVQVPKINGEY